MPINLHSLKRFSTFAEVVEKTGDVFRLANKK